MGIRLGVVLAVPLLVLPGCGDQGADDPGMTGRTVPDLDGTSWIATTISEGGKPHALVPGSELRVEFADGRISVDVGCNAMGGSYSLSAEAELTVGSLSTTEMACDNALMDQDAWVSGTLFAQPLVASVDGSTLVLSREGMEVTLTDRAVAAPDALLEGTEWRLDGVRTGDAVSSIPSGSHPATFMLASDGTVTVHTGCNGGRTTATVTGATITFGPVATTKMACADAAGRRTEAAVLDVLDGAVAWTITEDTLTLTRGDHGLVYRAAP